VVKGMAGEVAKAVVLGLDGRAARETLLPPQFAEAHRPDVIKRAFLAEATRKLQPKGVSALAGMKTTAEYYGRRHAWRQTINTGRSRLPREKLAKGRSGRVLMVPQAVKGRRAHPPKPWKRIVEKINSRERNLALRSAIAATGDAGLVKARGHLVDGVGFPLVVDDAIEGVTKVREAEKIFSALGLGRDIERAMKGRRARSGSRKGGRFGPKSVLLVVAGDKGVFRAARNIPGVDVVEVDKLGAEHLAPGGVAGRLAVWTEGALARLGQEKLFY